MDQYVDRIADCINTDQDQRRHDQHDDGGLQNAASDVGEHAKAIAAGKALDYLNDGANRRVTLCEPIGDRERRCACNARRTQSFFRCMVGIAPTAPAQVATFVGVKTRSGG